MKTIAVLTDLSKGSEHTAQYAFHLAKKMKAKIKVFQVCEKPVIPQLVGVGFSDSEAADEAAIISFGLQVSRVGAARTCNGYYLPEVLADQTNTGLVDVMTNIMQDDHISMVVTGPGKEKDLAAYLLSDECNRIIDWARVPVLIVPGVAPLRNPEKIAYAAQLHEEDINSIAELGELMGCFSAELMVAHLNPDPTDQAITGLENRLNRDLYQKLNCGGVYFRSIPDHAREKNWQWLKANKPTEMLAVMQQPRELLNFLFNRGRHDTITYHLTVPVMVLPKRP